MKLATAAQMQEIDRIAIHEWGIPSLDLMERAAEGVTSAVEDLIEQQTAFCPDGKGTVILG